MSTTTQHLGAGLALKPEHAIDALACRRRGIWFETHAENHLVQGGSKLAWIEAVREKHPVSLHGVSMSLGGTERLDTDHLDALCRLVRRLEPVLVSEHLAWSRWKGMVFPDLLPFAYTTRSLQRLVARIDQVQSALGRSIAIENPSHYLRNPGHEWDEIAFLDEVAHRTGCQLLVDLNNVYVSANNLGFDPLAWVDRFPAHRIAEIHLAGHSADPIQGAALLIDSHDTPVAPPVWGLLQRLLHRAGPVPCLIERDANLPAFETLLEERDRAQELLDQEFDQPCTTEPDSAFQADVVELLLASESSLVGPEARALAEQAGFAVYRNTVLKGCIDALQANFPAIVKLVGTEWFRSAALEFLRRQPPRHASLLHYGAGFPAFLCSLESTATLPYLSEVARLDQLWRESLVAADEPALDASALAAMTPQRIGSMVLRPHRAARWMFSPKHPIASLWFSNRTDSTTSGCSDYVQLGSADYLWGAEGLLLTRPLCSVQAIRIDAGTCQFLRACADGLSLAQAAEAVIAADPQADAASAFATLIVNGALSSAGVNG